MIPTLVSESAIISTRRPRGRGQVPRSPRRGRLHHEPQPVSLLDEAHRRTKANMQAIERRLRLGTGRVGGPSTESLLTGLQERVAASAALHRALCRSGHFERIDLAVYLKRVAGALSAAIGRGPEEEAPESAGWTVSGSVPSLIWDDGSRKVVGAGPDGNSSFAEALQAVPWERRETARRAMCAVAVLVPPTLFNWIRPDPGSADDDQAGSALPGQVSVRLGIAEGRLSIEISLAEGSLGLPGRFEDSQARGSFERQLADQLHELGGGAGGLGDRSDPTFVVRLVSTWARRGGRGEEIEARLAS